MFYLALLGKIDALILVWCVRLGSHIRLRDYIHIRLGAPDFKRPRTSRVG